MPLNNIVKLISLVLSFNFHKLPYHNILLIVEEQSSEIQYMMTKSPEKKRKVNPNNIKSDSPQKNEDWIKQSKIIILVGQDDQNTPWGYAFDNFYAARNIVKSLGNKMGDTTAIGKEEFKPFDNLTTKWMPFSVLGKNLWVIRIDNSDGCEKKFPIECHGAYANKIARGLIGGGVFKASQLDVITKKLSTEEQHEMDERFSSSYEDYTNEVIFHETIAVTDEALEDLI